MPLFNRIFGKGRAKFDAPIAPTAPFFAIGDVHGCFSHLKRLLASIETTDATAPIVFVGDYVDRGEQSADVLKLVMQLDQSAQITCLIGNHEEMLLAFLDDPAKGGRRFLRFGGLQTLASFGVGGATSDTKGDDLLPIADALRSAMGEEMIHWLRNLPTHWVSGNVAVVHAGADPALPIDAQTPKNLRWGHPDFDQTLRQDGVWVLHGHTIVDQANATQGRIAVDTGAYATGRLTAAYVSEGNVSFLQS